MCVVLVVIVGVASASADNAGDRNLSNSSTMEQVLPEGTWGVVKVTLCGRVLPFTDDQLEKMQLVFSHGKFKERNYDGAVKEGTYRCDDSKTPKHRT
jgi:hypothetical protein